MGDDVDVLDPFELELVEVETLPLELDEVEVDEDTFPLDDEETFPLDDEDTLPLDDEVLLTFPLEDVLLTLPLDVDEVLLTPPVDVDEEDPPVEDETLPLDPPEEVELDVEPPLELVDPPLELDVEETTIPLDPPPLPPKKPPAKKPPPNPPPNPPPMIAGGADGPVLASISGAGGSGTGGDWVETVTTVGSQVRGAGRNRVRAATRSTGRRTGFFAMRFLLNSVRGLELSATCTAPPPTIAPLAATAASFAKAIRTDMVRLSCLFRRRTPAAVPSRLALPLPDKCKTKI